MVPMHRGKKKLKEVCARGDRCYTKKKKRKNDMRPGDTKEKKRGGGGDDRLGSGGYVTPKEHLGRGKKEEDVIHLPDRKDTLGGGGKGEKRLSTARKEARPV